MTPAPVPVPDLPLAGFRIGEGWDTHALVEGRKLILGGVHVPFETGLLGHSDADVLLHAITDALLGAAGLGRNTLNAPKVVHYSSSEEEEEKVGAAISISTEITWNYYYKGEKDRERIYRKW